MTTQARIDEVVAAYGLTAYPYELRELNPLRDSRDLDFVVLVDGWQQADELDGFLAGRAQEGEPALILVAGGSGTGRSSLVNYLVHRWAIQRPTGPADPVVGTRPAKTYDAEAELWQWALSLRPRLVKAGVKLSDTTQRAFTELTNTKPAAMGASLQGLLTAVQTDLGPGSAFAGIIERVGHQDFLSLATECLTSIDTLLVMTVDATPGNEDEVISHAEGLLDPAMSRVVRLQELSGEEARRVVQERWTRCSKPSSPFSDTSPFSDQGLVEAFQYPPRSLRRVLRLVEVLLVNKTLSSGKSKGEAGKLSFDEDELRKGIDYWDAQIAPS